MVAVICRFFAGMHRGVARCVLNRVYGIMRLDLTRLKDYIMHREFDVLPGNVADLYRYHCMRLVLLFDLHSRRLVHNRIYVSFVMSG